MADIYLALQSNARGSTPLVLVNGATSTGYALLRPDWGNDEWQMFLAGARGTQGARPAGGEPQNRTVSFGLRITAASTDLMFAAYQALHEVADEMRRFGGRITWRPQGGSYRVHFDVLAGTVAVPEWQRSAQHAARIDVAFAAVCAPYALGDPMAVFDDFESDGITAGDYTVDEGSGTISVSGGGLAVSSTATKRLRRTLEGYPLSDAQVTVRVDAGSTITNLAVLVGIGSPDAAAGVDSILGAELTASAIRVVKRVAGSASTLATTAASPTVSTSFYVRFRREGRACFAEFFASEPTLYSAPTASVSYTLTADEASLFNGGLPCVRMVPHSTSDRLDAFEVQPFTYRRATLPGNLRLQGVIPGDSPALGEIIAGGATAMPWFGLGWAPRPRVHSVCWNGDFEDSTIAANGWVLKGSATLTGRVTTAAKFGTASCQIVGTASGDGARFAIYRRARLGQTFLALAWVRSAAATTAVRLVLGLNGTDVANGSNVTLSTSWKLAVVAWNPSAERATYDVVLEQNAAGTPTWTFDGVCVVEDPPFSTLASSIGSAGATTCTVRHNPPDLPATPFLAVVDSEIVLVTDASTTTWTIVRGQLGTTAATHSSAATVYALPALGEVQGAGAPVPFGVVQASNNVTGSLYTLSETTDAGSTDGFATRVTGLAGAGSGSFDVMVDPSEFAVPDDFTRGEIALDVYARLSVGTGLDNPTAILAAVPEWATFSSGVATSNYGGIRYADEFGSAGRVLVKGSIANGYMRLYRLGTIRLPVNAETVGRWRLQLRVTWGAATSGTPQFWADTLWIVPARARALGPTKQALDGAYPQFIASANDTTKRVRSDLSGLVARGASGRVWVPDAGLGGSLIEVPAHGRPNGCLDVTAYASTYVPDDPTTPSAGEAASNAVTIHLPIVPRYAIARGTAN